MELLLRAQVDASPNFMPARWRLAKVMRMKSQCMSALVYRIDSGAMGDLLGTTASKQYLT
jgi:hypothetical protein